MASPLVTPEFHKTRFDEDDLSTWPLIGELILLPVPRALYEDMTPASISYSELHSADSAPTKAKKRERTQRAAFHPCLVVGLQLTPHSRVSFYMILPFNNNPTALTNLSEGDFNRMVPMKPQAPLETPTVPPGSTPLTFTNFPGSNRCAWLCLTKTPLTMKLNDVTYSRGKPSFQLSEIQRLLKYARLLFQEGSETSQTNEAEGSRSGRHEGDQDGADEGGAKDGDDEGEEPDAGEEAPEKGDDKEAPQEGDGDAHDAVLDDGADDQSEGSSGWIPRDEGPLDAMFWDELARGGLDPAKKKENTQVFVEQWRKSIAEAAAV
ncbi:hypothetical protein B0H16DRAFT_1901341 [Mycena metata]|uniref:Uncharacterized protein n=1 Tax=Mycena metata TaxID=1033252 RepID=A0AAD7MAH5_9AGAR|nr:hypothetical protein B0H16DRAFT_1901341 [Mycena metata]